MKIDKVKEKSGLVKNIILKALKKFKGLTLKKKIVVIAVLVFAISVMFLGGNSEEDKMLEILYAGKAVDFPYSQSVGTLVPQVFTDYDITYESWQDGYIVTISGEFLVHPSSTLIKSGSKSYYVDMERETCTPLEDTGGVDQAFMIRITQ